MKAINFLVSLLLVSVALAQYSDGEYGGGVAITDTLGLSARIDSLRTAIVPDIFPETYPNFVSSDFKGAKPAVCLSITIPVGGMASMIRGEGSGAIRSIGFEFESTNTANEFIADSIWFSILGRDGRYVGGRALVTSVTSFCDSFPASALFLMPASPIPRGSAPYNTFYTSSITDTVVSGVRYRSYDVQTGISFSDGFSIWLTNSTSGSLPIYCAAFVDSGGLSDYGAMNYFHIDYSSHVIPAPIADNDLWKIYDATGLGEGVILANAFWGTTPHQASDVSFYGFIDKQIPIAICSAWVPGSYGDTCKVYAGGFDDWAFRPSTWLSKRSPQYIFIKPTSTPTDIAERLYILSETQDFGIAWPTKFDVDSNYFIAYANRALHHQGDTIYAICDADVWSGAMNHSVFNAPSERNPAAGTIWGSFKLRGAATTTTHAWVKIYRPAVRFNESYQMYLCSPGDYAVGYTAKYCTWSWTEESNAVNCIDSNRTFDPPDNMPQRDNLVLELRGKWPHGAYREVAGADLIYPIGSISDWKNLSSTSIYGFGVDARYDSMKYFISDADLEDETTGDTCVWVGASGSIVNRPSVKIEGYGDYIAIDSDEQNILGQTFNGDYSLFMCFTNRDSGIRGTNIFSRSLTGGRLWADTTKMYWYINGLALASGTFSPDIPKDSTWHTIAIVFDSSEQVLTQWIDGSRKKTHTAVNACTLTTESIAIFGKEGSPVVRSVSYSACMLWNTPLDSAEIVSADSLLRWVY